MITVDTSTLSSIINQCFNYSTDGRVPQAQQTLFLADGKRLRGLLLNLLSARFDEKTQEVLDANTRLTAVNNELSNSAAALSNIAQTTSDIATLVGNLDKLLNIAKSFV